MAATTITVGPGRVKPSVAGSPEAQAISKQAETSTRTHAVRVSRVRPAMPSSIELHESSDPADRHPFRHEDRTVLQEDRIVGMNESSRLEIGAWLPAEIRGMSIAEHGDGLVLLVVQRHHAFQIRDEHHAVAEVDVTRTSDPFGVQGDGSSIKVEHLHSTIAPIRDHHRRLAAAGVHPESVGTGDFALPLAGAGEDRLPLAVRRISMNEGTTVAIPDEQITVRKESDVGRAPLTSLVVCTTLHRTARGPDDLAVEPGLHDGAATGVTVIEELAIRLLPEIDAVSTTGELRTPVTDELALRRVDADPGLPGASATNGVGHVDPTRRILGEPVRVPELDPVRRCEPVMLATPPIPTLAENDRIVVPPREDRAPGGSQRRCDGGRGRGGDETTAIESKVMHARILR